jgi:hypothetical protein
MKKLSVGMTSELMTKIRCPSRLKPGAIFIEVNVSNRKERAENGRIIEKEMIARELTRIGFRSRAVLDLSREAE